MKPRTVLVRARRLTAAPWGFLVVLIDVTEVRRLESLRRDFVGNVSHELRTPVTAVRSAAETLRDAIARDPAMALRFVDIIERHTTRLNNLVEDLLDLSRIESRDYKLKVKAVDLEAEVTSVLALYKERAEQRGLTLVNDIQPGLEPLETDARALDGILSNLVDNAVKYASANGTITVSARRKTKKYKIRVSDSGPGIPRPPPAAAVRTVLPGRPRAFAGPRWNRPGPVYCQTPDRGHGWQYFRAQHHRRGHNIQDRFARDPTTWFRSGHRPAHGHKHRGRCRSRRRQIYVAVFSVNRTRRRVLSPASLVRTTGAVELWRCAWQTKVFPPTRA